MGAWTAARASRNRSGRTAPSVPKPHPKETDSPPNSSALLKDEEKARAEGEKARKKEEDRARAQEAKDAERRRKDEERAQREATKAREAEERTRAEALKKEQQETDRAARSTREAAPSDTASSSQEPSPNSDLPVVPSSKEDEKRRRELVKQIEKARAERDRLNQEAEEAERAARSARTAANDSQRAYEALATERLSPEHLALPVGRAATRRAARHVGQLARRSQVAGNADRVLHHGE